ncbi:hypothetical protein ACFV7Q_35280 [Streptomyces sp. NPDC059851]|uniref:hypothetical protein n=1 Tax=Streptomyces sp. NPDC059851 TaxID=3346971 RepID=UPI00364FF31B
MSFHARTPRTPRTPRNRTHPRPAPASRVRCLLAALLLVAFAAAAIGCPHHRDATRHGPASASASAEARSAASHPHAHATSHHPFTADSADSEGFPHPGESCTPNYPALPFQEMSTPRVAAFPVLLAVLLGFRSPHLPVRGQRHPSAFPVRAREGRTTRTNICCWRI